jgi:hypothetical protein
MRLKSSHLFTLLVAIAIFTYAYVYYVTAEHQIQIARETNVYNRTTSCILSVPLATRTYAYINECYNKAEKYNGIKVEHFGTEREYK